MKWLLFALLIWILYNLIFKMVLPVYKATSRFKQQFRDMQEKMSSQQPGYPQQTSPAAPARDRKPDIPDEDYIDFEEVKAR